MEPDAETMSPQEFWSQAYTLRVDVGVLLVKLQAALQYDNAAVPGLVAELRDLMVPWAAWLDARAVMKADAGGEAAHGKGDIQV